MTFFSTLFYSLLTVLEASICAVREVKGIILCAGGAMPLRLTAAKSRSAHAEPAAGAVGIAQAAWMLLQLQACHLTHLRNINPLIVSASKGAEHTGFALPRQQCAGITRDRDAWGAVQGVSSFAFQGTNAHAVLCTPGLDDLCSSEVRHILPLWQRQRYWYSGVAHELLHSAGVISMRREAVFQSAVTRACLGKMTVILRFINSFVP